MTYDYAQYDYELIANIAHVREATFLNWTAPSEANIFIAQYDILLLNM